MHNTCVIPLFKIAVMAVPLNRFYPFGTSYGDARIVRTDDSGSSLVVLMQNLNFFNISYTEFYVSDKVISTSAIMQNGHTSVCMLTVKGNK